jgi:5-methylcytosine-specific restriction protein A
MSTGTTQAQPRHRNNRRSALYKRDKGVCALCGLDTDALQLRLRLECFGEDRPNRPSGIYDSTWNPGEREWWKACARENMSPLKSFWEADHVQPFSEGGECSLDNLRTLCRPCHCSVTKKWRGAR